MANVPDTFSGSDDGDAPGGVSGSLLKLISFIFPFFSFSRFERSPTKIKNKFKNNFKI